MNHKLIQNSVSNLLKDLAKATLTLIPLFGVITFISILIPFEFIGDERRMLLKRTFQALESLTGGIVTVFEYRSMISYRFNESCKKSHVYIATVIEMFKMSSSVFYNDNG